VPIHPVWSEDNFELMDLAVGILLREGITDPTILSGRGLVVYVRTKDVERARAALRADARTKPFVVERP